MEIAQQALDSHCDEFNGRPLTGTRGVVFKLLLAELSTGRPRPPIHHSNSSWSHRSSLVMVMLVKPSSVAMLYPCCIYSLVGTAVASTTTTP